MIPFTWYCPMLPHCCFDLPDLSLVLLLFGYLSVLTGMAEYFTNVIFNWVWGYLICIIYSLHIGNIDTPERPWWALWRSQTGRTERGSEREIAMSTRCPVRVFPLADGKLMFVKNIGRRCRKRTKRARAVPPAHSDRAHLRVSREKVELTGDLRKNTAG